MKIFVLRVPLPAREDEPDKTRIQKQELIELPADGYRPGESTRGILQKIAQVNLQQLLRPKGLEPAHPKTKQLEFADNPFANPIFEYLKHEKNNQEATKQLLNEEPSGGIRRKITHHQSYMTPGYYPGSTFQPLMDGYSMYPGQVMAQTPMSEYSGYRYDKPPVEFNSDQNKVAQAMDKEKQLVENIKNIIAQQNSQYSTLYNPLMVSPYQNLPHPTLTPYSSFRNGNPYMSYQNYLQPPPYTKTADTYYANLQSLQDPETAKFLSPFPQLPSREKPIRFLSNLANMFPIVVKNPIPQIFNAFTSMIEYGPQADSCDGGNSDYLEPVDEVTEQKKSESRKPKNFTEARSEESTEHTTEGIATTTLDGSEELMIEGITITSNDKKDRGSDDSYITADGSETQAESLVIGAEEDKGIFSPNTKFDRENTGSGIFIHKIKVRKGGIAIAGPGGIATAGNGGTAIVGPNGWALTQPNGVAIAGPGAKVLAVDPQLDLNQLVMNIKRGDGSTPRVGKVVAVGPVVYRNVGQN